MTLYIDTRPQLEWIEYNGRFMADGYEIKQTPSGRWLLMWTIDNHHYHDTLDQAKAAAQADYDRRTAERFRAVEVPEHLPEDVTLHDLKRLRNYFGENDKTLFEHRAYDWLDSLIKHIAKATTPESLHTKP